MNVPSGYTALDLIGFTDKGIYNSSASYVKNDIVHYNGNLWKCLIDDTTGVTPAEGANWTIFLAEPSNAAEGMIAPIEDTATASRSYAAGDQLILEDILYKAKTAITVGTALVVDTNIELADDLTTQLGEKANSDDLGTAAAKDSTNTVEKNSTDLPEGGAVYSEDKKTRESIAPVEETATASQAYAAGEEFYYNGILYKATAAIAQGGTITPDTNCTTADKVSTEIKALKALGLSVVNGKVCQTYNN